MLVFRGVDVSVVFFQNPEIYWGNDSQFDLSIFLHLACTKSPNVFRTTLLESHSLTTQQPTPEVVQPVLFCPIFFFLSKENERVLV